MPKDSFTGFWISLMQSSQQLLLDVTYCKNAKVRYSTVMLVSAVNGTKADRHWTSMARCMKKVIRCMAKAASIKDMNVGSRIVEVRHWIKMAGVWAKFAREAATEAMAVIDVDGGRQQSKQPQQHTLLDDYSVVNEGVTQQTRAMAMFGEFSEFSAMWCFGPGLCSAGRSGRGYDIIRALRDGFFEIRFFFLKHLSVKSTHFPAR